MNFLLVFCAVALVVGACSPDTPASDWCYLFNFNTSDNGFTVQHGAGGWQPGIGFVTSSTEGGSLPYDLDLLYTHPTTVRPSAIRVFVARDRAILTPIQVKTYALVFGLQIGPAVSQLPAEQDFNYEATIVADELVEGNSVKIEASASQPLALRAIEIRGNGANPFGSSNCSTDAFGVAPIPIPVVEIFDTLQSANDQLASIDAPLTSPNGTPLLPSETGSLIFGYAKWLISPGGAAEIFGPFAGIVSHLSIYLAAQLALALVYSIAYAATYLIRWVVWLFKLILMIIAAIAEILGVVWDIAGGILSKVLKFI